MSLTILEISSVDEAVLLGGNVLGTGTNADKLNQLKKKHPNIKVKKFNIIDHQRIEEFIDDVLGNSVVHSEEF